MATSKAKKAQALDRIKSILGASKNLVLTEYRGLNVEQMTQLRRNLRKAGVQYKILKNTLVKKLMAETGIEHLEEYLHGPVGIGFLGADVAAATKAIIDFAKKNELLVVKAGYVEGKVVDLSGLKVLAALPSREVMLAILLQTMQAPLKGFMTVLQGNTQKLVCALNALKDKKAKAAA